MGNNTITADQCAELRGHATNGQCMAVSRDSTRYHRLVPEGARIRNDDRSKAYFGDYPR